MWDSFGDRRGRMGFFRRWCKRIGFLRCRVLLPYKLGLISGLFFGFAFGVAGIASAVLGNMADHYGIEAVYNVCGFMPLLGLVTWFLPNLKKK